MNKTKRERSNKIVKSGLPETPPGFGRLGGQFDPDLVGYKVKLHQPNRESNLFSDTADKEEPNQFTYEIRGSAREEFSTFVKELLLYFGKLDDSVALVEVDSQEKFFASEENSFLMGNRLQVLNRALMSLNIQRTHFVSAHDPCSLAEEIIGTLVETVDINGDLPLLHPQVKGKLEKNPNGSIRLVTERFLPLRIHEAISRLNSVRHNLTKVPLNDATNSAREARDHVSVLATLDHSEDYGSINYKGRNYVLTTRQAQIVEILNSSRESGHPTVKETYILERLGSGSRIKDTFRTKNTELFGTLIKRTAPGQFQLDF